MKTLKINYNLLGSLMLLLFISSCEKDDNSMSSTEEYLSTQIPNDITELFITTGSAKADTVWIFEQGGPANELDTNSLDYLPNHNDYLNVYVHQVLTYNNDLYNKNLTVEQAELETDVNSEILDRVIRYYKDQGKTVIVIGHSYGASVVTKYLSDKGSDLADKYVIMGSRLDAPQDFYKGLINNQYYYFPDYVTSTLHPSIQPKDHQETTELLLAGVVLKPRYTEELNDVDLTKLIYVFANDDDAVGRLSSSEKAFLVSKNVRIVEIESGGHGAMFDAPNNQIIYDLMIQ